MLLFLNIFFFVFHTALIAFNLAGWAFRRTRIANLATLGATFSSWFLLGIRYGFGYCPSTEWHWRVRESLGIATGSESYIKFLVDTMTGLNVERRLVDTASVVLLLGALCASITSTLLQRRRGRGGTRHREKGTRG